MINKIKLFLATAISSVLLLGCNSDEIETSPSYFSYNNQQFELTQGFLEYIGTSNSKTSGYKYVLTLASQGIEIDQFDCSGTGHTLFLGICSPSTSRLETGTYVYYQKETDKASVFEPFTFRSGNFELNTNYNNPVWENGYGIKSGYLTIVENKGEYEIIIQCISHEDKELTGYYKGSINFTDISI